MTELITTTTMHKGEFGLTILAIVAAGASVNFFIFGAAGIIPFSTYRDFVLFPSVAIIILIGIYGAVKSKRLANRLASGLWIGAVATLALEAIRIPGYAILHWLPGDDMIMMPGMFLTGMAPTLMDLMNMMMSGQPMQPSSDVMISGTLYHFWNGATMGAIYTLIMGKGRWHYGVIWGFIINIGMMLAPWLVMMMGPFGIKYMSGYNIFTIALAAHLAYGFVIGILAQRFVKEKESLLILLKQRQVDR
ncbi:MAG: hypothetical protein WEC35_06670 [Nitrosopumilaceae archaeon]